MTRGQTTEPPDCSPRQGSATMPLSLATCEYIKQGASVLVTGPAGVGKSFIASALGYQACFAGYKVRYANMQKLLEDMHMARIESKAARFFDKMATMDLLVIDDFGMKILDGQQLLDFMELIEDRHGRKSTIIASQLPVKNWYDILAKNPTIADAVLDRVVKSAYRIELKYRDDENFDLMRKGKMQQDTGRTLHLRKRSL